VAVNVELKHGVPSRRTLARGAARAVGESGADVMFSSFDPLLLGLVGAYAPGAPRAFLTYPDQARWADVLQGTARPPALRALHLERTQAVTTDLARYVERGLRLGAWTVNDEAEARALVRMGVASIITDAPGRVLAALARA
jgi:glycerophosphoryl diester phosphodiesterase